MDWRGLSHHGGLACHLYFCPSHRLLSPLRRKIVLAAAGDWHLLGLVAPEHAMLAAFFKSVEEFLGRPLPESVLGRPSFLKAVSEFFGLRRKNPWQERGAHARLVNYFFHDQEYENPKVDYAGLGAPVSRHDAVFRALSVTFGRREELQEAERFLDALAERAAREAAGVSSGCQNSFPITGDRIVG
jgi:hypothetical protein